MGSGKAVLRPKKDFTRPGLKRRIVQQIEDGTLRKAGVKPNGGEIKPKGAPLVRLEQTEGIKEESCGSEVNSFIEVDEAIKKELDDLSSLSSLIPYQDMEKYTTISMPILWVPL